MEGNIASLRIVLILCAVVIGRVRGEYDDEVWRRRSEEAKKAAQEAYHPDPLQVTADFNHQVHLAMEGISNTTRRDLLAGRQQKHKHACMATNPTDQCWRCDPNWANNRKKLANCAIGFGRGTTGGKAGEIYVVTDPSDDNLLKPKPGTLRYAVIQPRPLWIIFARSMFITLTQELMMTSDKTIDGRGANVHVCNGAQITIQFVKNIIIHGIHVHDNKRRSGGMIRDSVNHFGIRTQSDGDGISLFGATNIWIDHVSLSNCDDGLIDVIQGSTAITISNCLLTDHNEVMLFGASDTLEAGDRLMQMTVAFNHFGEGLVQRMPRCRWGFFHVVNNDYTHWHMYAIGGSSAPTIISQGNRFVAPADSASKEVTKRDYAPRNVWKNWNWRSEGDLLMNGAFFIESGKPTPLPRNHIQAKPGTMAAKLTRFAGALKCVPNRPC